MLVLCRTKDQEIILVNRLTQDIIRVTVTEIKGNRCRLGVHASQDWKILRDEILEDAKNIDPGEDLKFRPSDHSYAKNNPNTP